MEFKRYTEKELLSFKLTRDDSRNERYYIAENGTEYLSVTSFVGKFSNGKDDIERWKAAVGEKEAKRIVDAACERGTAIHLACENLLLNKPWQDISMFYRQDFIAMKKHLEENVDDIFALEHQMFSNKLKLAGTVDCIAKYQGEMCIIDFKTSSQLKYRCDINTYFLQCAAYGIMLFERYGIRVNELVILMCVEGDPQIQVFKEPFAKWAREIVKLTGDTI
jgi:ATP-dependent exoDNAse (exonuclease V) beta subunit